MPFALPRPPALVQATALVAAALVWTAAPVQEQRADPRAPLAVCFAPGTPQKMQDDVEARVALYQADVSDRWSFTATDGTIFRRGEPTTLTWNVVPDGTSIPGSIGEDASDSDLRAYLDSIYGSEAQWMPLFEQVFARWAAVSGVTYVRETADDGRSIGGASGSPGVRADIRIGGHAIDGNSGTLAYNFFPNDGDMVIDTADRYFRTTSSNSRRLRNVLAHEHGHGLGLGHVCPLDDSKLMEPFSSTRIDGPQLDDILAAQRLYGDRFETADTAPSAADLGALAPGTTSVEDVSIDGTSDTDVFAFRAPPGSTIDVQVVPEGRTYFEGPQSDNGSCSSGASFDALRLSDLTLEVLAPDGFTRLRDVDTNPAGGAEIARDVRIDSASAYFVRIEGSTDEAQMYRLDITVVPPPDEVTAVADAVQTPRNVPARIDVLANDLGLHDAPQIAVTSSPTQGTATPSDGLVRYVPEPGASGLDAFTYTITSGAESSSATVAIDILPAVYAGRSDDDTDGDLYPDELESALGTQVGSALSTPASGAPGSALVRGVRARLRFGKIARDALDWTAEIALPADVTLERLRVDVFAGGSLRTFTLDAKGRGKSSRDRLRIRRSKAGDSAELSLRLRRGDLVGAWEDEGFLRESGVRREYREVTLFVVLANRAFAATPALDLTVKRKSGKVRLRD